jgi:hypothetical protein
MGRAVQRSAMKPESELIRRKRYLVTGIPNMWEVSMGGSHTGCFKKSFTLLKAYIYIYIFIYLFSVQYFELS